MRRLIAALTAALTAAALLAVSPAGAVGGTTDLTVVHGIPGVTVDVYVDGALAIDDFAPEDVAGPLTFAAGTYEVEIKSEDSSTTILGPADVLLVAGASQSIIAHLDAGGDPTVSVVNNDTSTIGAGEGRITVRHLAAAPEVDILADGSVAFAGLGNGQSGAADLPAGTYGVTVNAAGTSTEVADLGNVVLPEDTNLIVYAVGDFDGGSFTTVAQAITNNPVVPGFAGAAIGVPATVDVVHGVPGLTVDVYLDDLLALPGFEPGTVTPPLLLPPGNYDVDIFPAGDPYVNGGGAISVADLAVPAGGHVAVVAHLADDGDAGSDVGDTPTASVFVNDVSPIPAGEARLTVRHVADAPAVDILAGGAPIIEDLAHAAEAVLEVPAGTYPVTVNVAGTDTVVADLGDVALAEGVNTIVYAYGEPPAVDALAPSAAGTFTVAVDTIPGLAAGGAFSDATEGFFVDDVRTMLQLGITTGTSPTTYAPDEDVTRGQMAAFLYRTLNLPDSSVDAFADDDGHPFEDEINALYAAGITTGVTPGAPVGTGRFAPDEGVQRDQMAGFLVRAFAVPYISVDWFTDDDGRTLEPEVNALAGLGITTGTTPNLPIGERLYAPTEFVTRGQMASFIIRSLGLSEV